MQITRSRPFARGVDQLMYVGDDGLSTTSAMPPVDRALWGLGAVVAGYKAATTGSGVGRIVWGALAALQGYKALSP